MPSANVALTETQESISRPIIFDIVKQVRDITRISPDATITYLGDMDKNIQSSSTLEENNRESKFANRNILRIEVEEDFDEDYLASTAISRPDTNPIINDVDIGFIVKPIYAKVNVVINIAYRNVSKTEALKWYNDNRINISNMRDVNLHTIHYHYPIPDDTLDLIDAIYLAKEATAGDGLDIKQYLQSVATPRLTIISSLDGLTRKFAIAETQNKIIGQFGFEPLPPHPEKEEGVEVWVSTFSYKFNYDKPVGLNMIYPIMVHNQLLPAKFVNYNLDPYQMDKIPERYSISLDALNIFNMSRIVGTVSPSNPILMLPKYDNFNPYMKLPGTATIFYALTQLEGDMTQLMNLTEPDYFTLDSELLQFIRDVEYQYICKPYQSFFNVSAYAGYSLLPYDFLVCDQNLNISYSQGLNIRKNNRVRFSLTTNLDMINKHAIERLYNYSKTLFAKVVIGINEELKKYPGIRQLSKVSVVDDYYINKIYRVIMGKNLINPGEPYNPYTNNNYYNMNNMYNGNLAWASAGRLLDQQNTGQDIGFKTVMTTGIIALKKT